MTPDSIYSPGGNGLTTGGLDDYLGPEAKDHSNLPEPAPETTDERPLDCTGADRNEPVCQIAEAEAELESGARTAEPNEHQPGEAPREAFRKAH